MNLVPATPEGRWALTAVAGGAAALLLHFLPLTPLMTMIGGGIPGSAGSSGATGAAGATGATGSAGSNGAAGPTGATGPSGPSGASGGGVNSDAGRAAMYWKTANVGSSTTLVATAGSNPTASGTAASQWTTAQDKPGVNWTCANSNPSRCGVASSATFADMDISTNLRPKIACRIKTPASLANMRIYCIATASTHSATDVVAGGATGADTIAYYGWVYSAAQDSTHWLLCNGNATTQGCAQGPAITTGTWYLPVSDLGYTTAATLTGTVNGAGTTTRTTQLPSSATSGGPEMDLEALSTAQPIMTAGFMYAEWDN